MKRDIQFLLDMLQSAELIMQYTAEYSKNDFIENIQLQDSVIRRLLLDCCDLDSDRQRFNSS